MADDKTFSQADLDTAIKKAVALNEAGITAKNTELMDQLKELQRTYAPFKDLDADEIKRTLADANKQREADLVSKGEWETLNKEKDKQHAIEKEKWEGDRENWKKGEDERIRNRSVRKAMQEAEIDSNYEDSFVPMLNAKIVLVGEGDKRIAMIGDKTPAEWAKEFVTTDKGKNYIRADGNLGGGAPGSGQTQKFAGGNPWAKDSFNLTEQMAVTRKDPTLAKQMKQAAGKP